MTDDDPRLVVSFTPDAIRDHFDGYGEQYADELWVAQATDEQLRHVGEFAIDNELLWSIYDDLLRYAINLERKELLGSS